jgi:hypothetical protein
MPPLTLTQREVRELKARLASGQTSLDQEARRFGCRILTIARIASGEAFHDLPREVKVSWPPPHQETPEEALARAVLFQRVDPRLREGKP